jgi:hypothetical protein
MYNDILDRLNLSTRQYRWRHLKALFLRSGFTNNICCSSILSTVRLHLPTTLMRDYSTPDALHLTMASPSATSVTVANAVCKNIDIFNHHSISLKHIIESNVI